MTVSWDHVFEASGRRLAGSPIRELQTLASRPDVISFAGGLPAPELFPVEALRQSFDRVLRDEGAAALQYGHSDGHLPLRRFLAERLAARGIAADPSEIIITTGSQQALALLGAALLGTSSRVVVEAPSYVGALQAFSLQQPAYVPVPMDGDGLIVEEAARVLAAERATMLYTIATFQNPSGVTMSLPRRQALLDLVNQHGLPLIEDDPYGELRYEGAPLPSLRALPGGQDTVYLGSFSKVLSPGLRVGFAVAPEPLIARMVLVKQGLDLHTDALAQHAVLDFCLHNDLDAHIARLRTVYGERRAAMLSGLDRFFPASCSWARPQGGLFTWVTLPEHLDAVELLKHAVRHKVAFVPGRAFFTDGSGANTLRLNFSHSAPEKIEEGLRRLGALVHEQL